MAKQLLYIPKFSGGLSPDDKEGVQYSFAGGEAINFRKKPTLLSVYPKTAKNSGNVVTDLVVNSCRVKNGDTYFVGDTGRFYKKTAAGVWSYIGDIGTSAYGMTYDELMDAIYMTTPTDVALYYPVSNSPTLTTSKYTNITDQSENKGTGSVTLATTIAENITTMHEFSPQIEPLYSIKVWVVAKGTGNWTLTLHDAENNSLGTVTIANASLTNGQLNEFAFTSPVRILAESESMTYHFHLTSTVADGTAQTYVSSIGTCTISNASPAVVTKAAHGLASGDAVYFTTTDTLPAGLSVNTKYYVISAGLTSGVFEVSADKNGTAIKTTSAGAGTHTLLRQPLITYETWVSRLVSTQNGMHPSISFQNFLCIGNGRYLTAWEPTASVPTNNEWKHIKLAFPVGYEVCGLALYDEFLAIACEKRSSDSSKEFQDGKIFFWDGTAATFNYFVDVPEGAPYSIFSHKNIISYIAGGEWFAYAGGQPVKLWRFPNTDGDYTDANDYIVNYPNMAAVRKGILMTGFPSETSNQTIKHGVYSYGSMDKNHPNAFGYDYVISTGTKLATSTLRIGHVANYGEEMYIAWRDGATYGVDIVNNSSDPATSFSFESLIFDDQRADKEKLPDKLIVGFKPLPAGASITPKYKIDREASWTEGTTVDTDDATEATMSFNGRFKEIQIGFDGVAGAITPEIIYVALVYDPLKEEKD